MSGFKKITNIDNRNLYNSVSVDSIILVSLFIGNTESKKVSINMFTVAC